MAAKVIQADAPATEDTAGRGTLSLDQLESRKRKLIGQYIAEERLPIVLAPMYAAYFGNVMTVALNGISIKVRVDGSSQKVPKSFADEIDYRRMQIDQQLRRQQRMSNISANIERNPGELPLY